MDKPYYRQFHIKALVFFSLLFTSAFVLFVPKIYADSPGNIYPPFDIGAQWNVCQGYDSGTHKNDTQNGSRLSFDFTNSGCDNAAAQRVVRAPFTGTVSWYVEASGSLCITSQDNSKSVMLTHIDRTIDVGAQVDNYQMVGKIATPNNRANNGVAHLHLQAWSSRRCQGNANQVPFDSAHQTRICGAPDLPESGPRTFGNGTWGSTRFVGDACSITVPASSPSVFRLYNTNIRQHLFTTDVNEVNVLRNSGSWNFEGSSYWVKSAGSCSEGESVYRFYSERLKLHLYTMDENERNVLSGYPPDAWRYEGLGFCASRSNIASTRPVYRFYSDGLKSYLFTVSEDEKNSLSTHPEVWRYEGVAYYAF